MGNNISYQSTPCTADLGGHGKVVGVRFDHKARRFAGIPYALPPTGEYRWCKPRPLPPDHSYSDDEGQPFDATEFYPACWQKTFSSAAEQGRAAVAYSEDCLRLNIWTPVPQADGQNVKWPVYVWLHGGWFQMGDPSQEPGMDPTELISTAGLNAVVVAVGYRLNVFGFLASDVLMKESEGHAGGNYGLWDQRLAMEWIYDNISAFGGDTGNITLAGRSAGAYSVHAQVLHEFRSHQRSDRKLFHRFFMCSNAIPSQPKHLQETQEQFDELCHTLKIDISLDGEQRLAALRKITAADLIGAIGTMTHHTFRPVTDDRFIHRGLVDYHTSGVFAAEFQKRGCRLLIGEVLNEETLYATYNSPSAPTFEALQTQVHNYYAQHVTDRILPRYQMPTTTKLSDWKTLFGVIISDGQVRAPSRLLVDCLLAHGISIRDIWRYQIAYRLSFIDEKVAPNDFGVAHAMDKPFWNFSITHGPSAAERALMKTWITCLTNFVQNNSDYDFGTHQASEFKVVTSQGTIEIQQDLRFDQLVVLGRVFAGD